MSLQEEYLQNKSSLNLYKELFQAIYDTAIINLKSLRKGKIDAWQEESELETLAEDVTLEIVERYKKDWCVHKNFGAVIHQAARKRLFDSRLKNRDISDQPRYGKQIECIEDNKALEYATDTRLDVPNIDLSSLIRKCSFYVKLIRKTKTAKNYHDYIQFLMQRRSLDWIGTHLDDIKKIWNSKRGQ
jgi:hypothetical protein